MRNFISPATSLAAMYRAARQRASKAVARAVRAGLLPRLDGSISCVDCGKPAEAYDHRDYTEPLVVSPVCTRCNVLRGPGRYAFVPARGEYAPGELVRRARAREDARRQTSRTSHSGGDR
jgi:hypothetical protein